MMTYTRLASVVGVICLTACAGYEAAKSTDFATIPTATVRFAAASGITANLKIADSVYRGSLGAAASCGQDFNGCYPLAGGSGGEPNLCPGEWYLGSQALLFDTTDVACGGVPLAECTLGSSSGNVQSFSPGSNPVEVLCTAYGSDVVFDVTLCSGAGCGACTPTTCAARGKDCGSMSDGCGATLNCGSCSGAQTCGGAGTANVCGTCTPTSCAAAGKDCGTMSDGCGTTLTCGTCVGSATCGGTGAPGVCGTCANTCSSLGKTCGSLSNGCGGTLSCGTCTGTDTCSASNVCAACVPKTCAQLGKNCGSVSDGCGGTVNCGNTCLAGQTCTNNLCAGMIRYTFAGHINSFYDGIGAGSATSFAPIPVGSAFSGCFSFDSGAVQSGWLPSLTNAYYPNPLGSLLFAANGHVFSNNQPPNIYVNPQWGFGVGAYMTLPSGWMIERTNYGSTSWVVMHMAPNFLPGPGDPIPTILTPRSPPLAFAIDLTGKISYPGGSYTGRPIMNGVMESLTPGECSCAVLGKNCGSLSNGTGGTLECGACTGTDVCTANVCTTCVPKTCVQLGATCGSVSDGCGGTLTCGGICGRSAFAMAYDGARVIMFGGGLNEASGFRTLGDTVAWNGTLQLVESISPASSPGGRYGHKMAYDPVAGKILMFGGATAVGPGSSGLAETWLWEGAQHSWTQAAPASSPPPSFFNVALVYDGAAGNLMMFGAGGANSESNSTFVWQRATSNWRTVFPATRPPARVQHPMAYDAVSGKVVLFGGYSGGSIGDTWLWDGVQETWTPATPTTSPGVRTDAAMAYDAARGKVVMFGGHDGSNLLADTWLWDGSNNTWTRASPAHSPSARVHHSMAYDEAGGTVLLFGGFAGQAQDDLWSWNGSDWTKLTP